jgi:nicotinamide phosphoribosyltransferase
MILHNLVYTLDSYKQLHDVMYPEGTETVYSYLEARKGGMYPYTTFFGLQYILKHWLEGIVVTKELIDEAEPLLKEHFKFNGDVWNRGKWDYIVNNCGGKLPVKIKAVKEGQNIPIGNVLVTVENTDSKCFWLTNALETVLQQVWYTTTVCTRSNLIVNVIKDYFKQTVEDSNQWLSEYYLHDFGMRGTSGMEESGLGGMSHLVNSKGTDTVMAMPFAIKYYNAKTENLGYSVPASEHSIATSLGEEDEFKVTQQLIKKFPKGILSVVSDSYDVVKAVNTYCTLLKNDILNRDGKFVVRPDSPRFDGDTPQDQVLWIVQTLWNSFGGIINGKGYKTLDSHIGVIYGDSLTELDIENILKLLKENGFSALNCVYGCGGYLLRKVNRDSLRFAFKSSAQQRNGVWYDIYKKPKDLSKASKKGKLKLIKQKDKFDTVNIDVDGLDLLNVVFENGKLINEIGFDQIRNNSKD